MRSGLSVGMKNGVEVLDHWMARAFDWSLNEECFYYHECGRERPFIDAGKAVFQTEYTDDWRHRGLRTPERDRRPHLPGRRAVAYSRPWSRDGCRTPVNTLPALH